MSINQLIVRLIKPDKQFFVLLTSFFIAFGIIGFYLIRGIGWFAGLLLLISPMPLIYMSIFVYGSKGYMLGYVDAQEATKEMIENISDNIKGSTSSIREIRAMVATLEQELETSPEVFLRKRGAKPTPLIDKVRIVYEWYQVQDKTLQDIFCSEKGISVTTLRRWMTEKEVQNELVRKKSDKWTN